MIEIYTDGLAEPNPGIGTYGYVIYRDGKELERCQGFAGEPVSNNYAEYAGLVETLRAVAGFSNEEIVVRSDSKLLVNQMTGTWKVSKKAFKGKAEGTYVDKYIEARDLARKFAKIEFRWIPREENVTADELSRIAYSQQLAKRRRRAAH